jgi:hypothetical protein
MSHSHVLLVQLHSNKNTKGKTKESLDTRPQRKYRERKERSKEDEYLLRYIRELEYDRETILAEWKHQFVSLDRGDVDWEYSDGTCSSLCRKFVDPCIGSVMNFLRWEPVDDLSCARSLNPSPSGAQAYLLPSMMERGAHEHYGSVVENARFHGSGGHHS